MNELKKKLVPINTSNISSTSDLFNKSNKSEDEDEENNINNNTSSHHETTNDKSNANSDIDENELLAKEEPLDSEDIEGDKKGDEQEAHSIAKNNDANVNSIDIELKQEDGLENEGTDDYYDHENQDPAAGAEEDQDYDQDEYDEQAYEQRSQQQDHHQPFGMFPASQQLNKVSTNQLFSFEFIFKFDQQLFCH
jgi:hypothetical protein